MERKDGQRSTEAQERQQPGNLESFNQRNEEKGTEAEGAVKGDKDESESYMDYNGNSEQNAPARARE